MVRITFLLGAMLGCAAAAGCNAIFGICDGVASTGTSSGTGGAVASSSGTGGTGGGSCNAYAGMVSATWGSSTSAQANIPSGTFEMSDSTFPQTFDASVGISTIEFSGSSPGFCSVKILYILTGAPVGGVGPNLVDMPTCDATITLDPNAKSGIACLQLQAVPALDGGGCASTPPLVFAATTTGGGIFVKTVKSIGPSTQEVQLTSSVGAPVTLDAVTSTGAMGTLQLNLTGEADCFSTGSQ